MKKLPVVALPVLLFGAVACEDGPTPESAFIQTVNENSSRKDFSADADRRLVDAGHKICGQLRAGTSFDAIALGFISAGISPENGAAVMASATIHLCPEFADDGVRWANS